MPRPPSEWRNAAIRVNALATFIVGCEMASKLETDAIREEIEAWRFEPKLKAAVLNLLKTAQEE